MRFPWIKTTIPYSVVTLFRSREFQPRRSLYETLLSGLRFAAHGHNLGMFSGAKGKILN